MAVGGRLISRKVTRTESALSDLVSYQNDRKSFTRIIGKVEVARVSIPRRA
jgi:hypothetical protein